MSDRLRRALVAALAAGVGGGLLALLSARVDDEAATRDEETATTERALPLDRPTTTSSTDREHLQMSLVAPGQEGVVVRWRDVEIRAAELVAVTERTRVPDAPEVRLDAAFVEARASDEVRLDRLRRQLQLVTRSVLDAWSPEARGAEAAVVVPPRAIGGGIETALLVVNPEEPRRPVRSVDLTLLDHDGEALTDRTRFFERREVVVPARGGYFGAVVFGEDAVRRPDADLARARYEATVDWGE